tara:strand:- start:266 stop:448 length:183 start_codon:yes stop_codon:yes gene_type:complete
MSSKLDIQEITKLLEKNDTQYVKKYLNKYGIGKKIQDYNETNPIPSFSTAKTNDKKIDFY